MKRTKFNLKHPSAPKDLSTKELLVKQKKTMESELGVIYKEMNKEAMKVVESYRKKPVSGSNTIVQIHEESPILDEENKKND